MSIYVCTCIHIQDDPVEEHRSCHSVAMPQMRLDRAVSSDCDGNCEMMAAYEDGVRNILVIAYLSIMSHVSGGAAKDN